MSKLVIYTAIAGAGRDTLREVKREPGVDYVCFTDQPFQSQTWEMRPFVFVDEDPVLTAKHPRVFPHEHFPGRDISVWVDGTIKPLPGIVKAAESALSNHDIALHDHSRCCHVFDELSLLRRLGRWPDKPLAMQEEEYHRIGVPKRRHWETGIMFRRHNGPKVIETMELWWSELLRHRQFRDQSAFFYSAWKTGLKVNTLPGNLRRAPYLQFFHHKKQVSPEVESIVEKNAEIRTKRKKITKADLKTRRTLRAALMSQRSQKSRGA